MTLKPTQAYGTALQFVQALIQQHFKTFFIYKPANIDKDSNPRGKQQMKTRDEE